ncbi:MAG: hypothetical protein HUU16_19715 [Candidatus Omnitrophica bacterium]|nr:hypothetical protein [Candidatus Omnitrophota bacterium]
MAAVVAELERMSGKSFTTVYDLPPEDVMSVAEWTEAERSRREKEAKKERLAMLPDVEIPISEAWQEIPEVEIRSVTATETTYRYDFEEMRVISETKQRVRPEEVVTGRRIKRLKSGVRFDEKTGKFCRRPSLNEVEITPVPTPALPDWVLSRVPEERR